MSIAGDRLLTADQYPAPAGFAAIYQGPRNPVVRHGADRPLSAPVASRLHRRWITTRPGTAIRPECRSWPVGRLARPDQPPAQRADADAGRVTPRM